MWVVGLTARSGAPKFFLRVSEGFGPKMHSIGHEHLISKQGTSDEGTGTGCNS